MKPNLTQAWQVFRDYEIDALDTQLSFCERLAHENNWSLDYAQKVFLEYKRFLFLFKMTDHPVTPSDQVDQAWHLHLTYTQNYWEELCKNLLKQNLHHGPTKGGPAEEQKYLELYQKTLQSYEKIFGFKPPIEIWPAPKKRFEEPLSFKRINTQAYFLIPKKNLYFSLLLLITFYFLLLNF